MAGTGELSENMKVHTRDGEELGTIIRLEGGRVLVEKRSVSPFKDYSVPVDLVADVRDGIAYLSVTRDDLHREMGEGAAAAERTLREEASQFVHEGEDIGRTPDNLREGEGPGAEP